MWSGPRNLSTALMRSFENRDDTKVWDEPLYAYYLNITKLDHPMYSEIIDKYKTNINDLINDMISLNNNYKISYLKHMSHHLLDETPINWIREGKNCILIRQPKKVISSYLKNNSLQNSKDLGFPDQYKIFKYLLSNNLDIIVINADDLINNTDKTIKSLCKKLKINFTNKMLLWPKGMRKSDGIWGKVWYKNVIQTNSFQENISNRNYDIPEKYINILNECNKIYNELNSYNIMKF